MASRFDRIFLSQKNIYKQSSPVVIKAGALLSDTESGDLYAQLKFCNISDKDIKFVKAEITCLDSMGRDIGDTKTLDYLDLLISRNQDFGSQIPIKISNGATRSFSARIVEVGFVDNSLWNDDGGNWEPLPEQADINTVLSDALAVRGYENRFGKEARLCAVECKDLWLCTCGAINHSNEEKCNKCKNSLEEIKSITLEDMKKEGTYALAYSDFSEQSIEKVMKGAAAFKSLGEFKDSKEMAERCEEKLKELKELEERKRKNKVKRKKIIKLSAIFSVVAIFVALLGAFVIYPFGSVATGNFKVYIDMYNVEHFDIPEGTTVIDDYEFYNCKSLRSVTIPDSVTTIGSAAFLSCSKLTSVTIGNGVTTIGNSAFYWCESLTSVTIPDSVTSIGDSAFHNCYNLTSVTIPDSVTSIGDSAFYNCYNLTSVTIPDSVTTIGDEAFYNCDSLTSVTIPDSVKTIGDAAFYGCDSLTSVTIGNSVTSIGSRAFEDCDSLDKVYISDIAKWCAISFGSYDANPLYYANKFYMVGSDTPITNLVIPEGVTSIGYYAFPNCDSLTSVTIGNGVTSVGESAFYYSSSLTSVTIPDSVTSIGSRAFYDCDSLKSIKYRGTSSQWSAILRGYGWDYNTGSYTITYNYTGE